MRKIISVTAISAVIITLFVPWFYASGAQLTWTQTDQAEFNAGVLVDVDTSSNPDNVELSVGADLVIDGGTATLGGDQYYDNVSIINGGTLYVQDGAILRIYAKDIYIDASSSIIADTLGYAGGARNYTQGVANDGSSHDGTPGTGGGVGGYSMSNSDGPGGGGAGYGGAGGDGGGAWGGDDHPGAGGAAYGNDSDQSIYMGSGGGAGGASQYAAGTYGGAGGQGGGAVLLDAETIDIAGTVSASGGAGEAGFGVSSADGGGGGGGSGGTILINGETVTITGTVAASGGNGGPRGPEYIYGGAGGGGGGGRIKVFYESLSDGTASYSAAGGNSGEPSYEAGTAQDGQSGTTYKGTTSYVSSLPYLSSGTLASQVLDTLTADSIWDELSWNETLPANTDITFGVRADNAPFAAGDANPTWTDLSPADSPITTGLPTGQYMQWRATLSTTDTSQTPVLHDVSITYTTVLPNTPPDIPTLNSPSDGATDVVLTPNLVFDYFDADDDDCTEFEILVDDDPGFGSPDINDAVLGSWPSPGPITYNVTTPLAPGTQYYWQVDVFDDTEWSGWSDGMWDFTTGIQDGGAAKAEYHTCEDVYVNATGFPTNSLVDVYVVGDEKWHDGDTIANYGIVVMETFTTDSNGDIVNKRLWRHPLEVGEYDIVFDAGPGGIPDGIYDEIPDLVDDPNHPGFTVISTPVGGEVYPIDKTALLLPWLISSAILILAAGGLMLIRRRS